MHRFRRKSETKRSTAVPGALLPDQHPEIASLPTLPPASDFRTSLILPSLSRRFTILRNSSGEPLTPAQVRSRLAEQRSRGLANHITEEEEDLMVEALEQMRSSATSSTDASAPTSQSSINPDGSSYFADSDAPQLSPSLYPESAYSATPSAKRSDNNLFSSGSNRLREENYIRSVAKTSNRSLRSTVASTPTSSPSRARDPTRSARAETPENPRDGTASSILTASPEGRGARTVESLDSYRGNSRSTQSSLQVTPALVRRASLALAQALRELEREMGALQDSDVTADLDDDDTVLAQFQAVGTGSSPSGNGTLSGETINESNEDYWRESRSHVSPEPSSPLHSQFARVGSASPVPRSEARVPGYVPGMHRPITPARESDYEEFPTYSNTTTPRATSPTSPVRDTAHRAVGSVQISSPPLRKGSPSFVRTTGGSSHVQSLSYSSSTESTTPVAEATPRDRIPMASAAIPPHLSSTRLQSRPSSPLATGSARSSPRPLTPVNQAGTTPQTALKDKLHTRNDSSISLDGVAQYASTNHYRGKTSIDRSLTSSPETPEIDKGFHGHKNWGGFPTGLDSKGGFTAGYGSAPLPISALRKQSSPSISSLSPSVRAVSPAPKSSPSLAAQHTPNSSGSSGFFQYDRSPTAKRFPEPPSSLSDSRMRPISPPAPYTRALVFSPMLNSSRSSVVSEGSSYHSEDEGNAGNLRKLYEVDNPPADEGLDSDPTMVNNSDTSEDVLEKYAGLTGDDIALMHAKLVQSALSERYRRPGTPESHRRPPSSASPNQHVDTDDSATKEIITYQPPSRNGSSSALPQAPATPPISSPAAERTGTPGSDNASKADALLRSVMDSIGPPSSSTPPPIVDSQTARRPTTASPEELSGSQSSTDAEQRRRDLMDALSVSSSAVPVERLSPKPSVSRTTPPPSDSILSTRVNKRKVLPDMLPPSARSPSPYQPPQPQPSPQPQPQPATQTLSQSHSPTPSPSPPLAVAQSADEPKTPSERLHDDVERQASAATAALKSPSVVNVAEDGFPFRRKATKRIKTSKISNPLLVSSTTSIDAMPAINSPSMASLHSTSPGSTASKFSLRKLRNTMRSKQSPNGEEVTPWIDGSSPGPSSQFVRYRPAMSPSLGAVPISTPMSAFKFPPADPLTPPVSTGPKAGLKGFMARMRRSKKEPDSIPEETAKHAGPSRSRGPSPPEARWGSLKRPGHSKINSAQVASSPGSQESVEPPHTAPLERMKSIEKPASPSPPDDIAWQQLFDAATNLGLGSALNDFLSRSGSINSQTTSRARPASPGLTHTPSASVSTTDRPVESPTPAQGSVLARQLSSRAAPSHLRPQAPSADSGNVVVRRTLYIPAVEPQTPVPPSPAALEPPVRKSSLKHRHTRSTSVTSIGSQRAVFDRAPTPPPSKSSRHRSLDPVPSPPVPQLPPSIKSDNMLSPARPRSNQLSIHDMYENGPPQASQFGLAPSVMPHSPSFDASASKSRSATPSGAGPALQLLEYSNGQLVWSVVDGLRSGVDEEWDLDDMMDDSVSSIGRRRASGLSDMSSVRGDSSQASEAMQLLFKEHRRVASKDSNTSYVSRRKVLPPSRTDLRPETKIFYSSAAEIENLIESISRGLDAGSFNVLPRAVPTEPVPSLPSLHVQRRTASDSSRRVQPSRI